MMTIHVNGEQRDVPVNATIGDLLGLLSISSERVAVELNLKILERDDFARATLQEGDTVEIISFIGGGAFDCISNAYPPPTDVHTARPRWHDLPRTFIMT